MFKPFALFNIQTSIQWTCILQGGSYNITIILKENHITGLIGVWGRTPQVVTPTETEGRLWYSSCISETAGLGWCWLGSQWVESILMHLSIIWFSFDAVVLLYKYNIDENNTLIFLILCELLCVDSCMTSFKCPSWSGFYQLVWIWRPHGPYSMLYHSHRESNSQLWTQSWNSSPFTIPLQTVWQTERIPINSIELMYVQTQVPDNLRIIDFDTLVGFNHQHSLEVRNHIAEVISTFLCSITSSIWPRTLPHLLHCEQYLVLLPVLYILFMNDHPLHVDSSTYMHADDSTLGETGETVKELNVKLNEDKVYVKKWCHDNQMAANGDKTTVILVTKEANLPVKEITVYYDNNFYKSVDSENVWVSKLTNILHGKNMLIKQPRKLIETLHF